MRFRGWGELKTLLRHLTGNEQKIRQSLILCKLLVFNEWAHRDLNPGPKDYEFDSSGFQESTRLNQNES
jgi:hypothetical protein